VKVLTVDAARSKLGAVGAKVTAHHPIDFKAYTGSVELSGDQVVGLSYEADMTTLESDHPKLTEHLKDADFFDVAKFPKSTFKAVTFAPGATGEGAEGMTHTVVGDLTIRGTTKRVTFPAKIEVKPEAVEATTEFSVNRQDFGIVYAGKADDLIQDKVVIKVQFVAPRGA
jgi:polyisoprenoid-binding protein YceI